MWRIMPKKSMSVHEAAQIARKIAASQNVELVDTELKKEPTGYFLRFYIETEEGVKLSELEAFHREIQPLVENVEYDFMEVSSPGVDRPLKTERDFEKALELPVDVKTYKNIDGRKQFEGILKAYDAENVTLEFEDGTLHSFARKDIGIIRPHIEFNEEDL